MNPVAPLPNIAIDAVGHRAGPAAQEAQTPTTGLAAILVNRVRVATMSAHTWTTGLR